jgi:hypothetical protein
MIACPEWQHTTMLRNVNPQSEVLQWNFAFAYP